jgi:hypothetical protein
MYYRRYSRHDYMLGGEMYKEVAAEWQKARVELEASLKAAFDGGTFLTVKEAVTAAVTTAAAHSVHLRQPLPEHVYTPSIGPDRGGGLCTEITYKDESVGMLVVEWGPMSENGCQASSYLV